jgi:hypothetical protein
VENLTKPKIFVILYIENEKGGKMKMVEYKIEVVEKESDLLTEKVMESLMIIRNGRMPEGKELIELEERIRQNVNGLLYGALVDIATAELHKAFKF